MYRVLLVDDEKNDREGIQRNISWMEYGMEVCGMAVNGKQGLEMALTLHPDIIISDVSMPFMNGLDMVREYQKTNPNVVSVFMTCFEEFEFAKSAISLNAAAYILKPICLEELSEVLKKVSKQKTIELEESIHRQYMEQTIEKSKSLLLDEFYRDLLLGVIESKAEFEERAYLLNFKTPVDGFACMYIQIDNYGIQFAKISARERFFLHEMMLFTIRELLNKNEEFGAIKVDNRSVAIIRLLEVANESENREELVSLAIYIQQQLNMLFEVDVSVCISELVQQPRELAEQYAVVRNAMDSLIGASGNQVVIASEIIDSITVLTYDLQDIKEAVLKCVVDREEDLLYSILDMFFSKNINLSKQNAKAFAYAVISTLHSVLLENSLNSSHVFDEVVAAQESLAVAETVSSMRNVLNQVIQCVNDRTNTEARSKSNMIVHDIESYIKKNYKTISCVAEIAEHLDISLSYANSVYKKHRGMTIFEHLVSIKMEAAARKLREPYCRINEVASELGYTSSAYFSNVFKRYFHMTPKAYRDGLIKIDQQ